jgi:Family of unknown function (DUF6551)
MSAVARLPGRGNSRDEWLPVNELKIDPRYQRVLQESKVKRMIVDWSDDEAGVIEVSRRSNGDLIVMDGQHRMIAARRLGITHLRALVHDGMTYPAEARLFVRLNTERTKPNKLSTFNGRIQAEDPVAIGVRDAILEAGFTIATSAGGHANKAGRIVSVDPCERLYLLGLLPETLRIVKTVWPDDPQAITAAILSGVGAMLYCYRLHPNFNLSHFEEALSRSPVRRILQRAKETGSLMSHGYHSGLDILQSGVSHTTTKVGYPQVRDAMLYEYNRGLRKNQLPPVTQSELKLLSLGRNPWKPS